jgi:hypothetical protein
MTGALAAWRCPEKVDEIFIEGTEPAEKCPSHSRRRWWWSPAEEEPE